MMTVRELFDFITDVSITQQNLDQYLDKVGLQTHTLTLSQCWVLTWILLSDWSRP